MRLAHIFFQKSELDEVLFLGKSYSEITSSILVIGGKYGNIFSDQVSCANSESLQVPLTT
jgi:hypothetical protein